MTRIMHGDCLELLATLPAESVDACVTDPPYELGFMGKHWDKTGITYDAELWRAVARVLKPGAHLAAFGGTRTAHRIGVAIEDAGFEIRDSIAWMYGQGFPKSLNLGEGLGTALKPAHEPIVLARKPFKGSVTANVAKHGTGALNIDACRIDGEPWEAHDATGLAKDKFFSRGETPVIHKEPHDLGRWPANVALDELAAMVLDEQSGELADGSVHLRGDGMGYHGGNGADVVGRGIADSGGASRFYYVAKPSREERDMGCYGLQSRTAGECTDRQDGSAGLNNPRAGAGRTGGGRNFHPTVKPVELMRWLVKLVTPINGTVIDPFLGSGTTGMACRYELRNFIGIEREAEYIEIAERRIAAVTPLFAAEAGSIDSAVRPDASPRFQQLTLTTVDT